MSEEAGPGKNGAYLSNFTVAPLLWTLEIKGSYN